MNLTLLRQLVHSKGQPWFSDDRLQLTIRLHRTVEHLFVGYLRLYAAGEANHYVSKTLST